MKALQIFVIFVLIIAVHSQFDGSFWWMNKNLMKEASQSRSMKEQSARIRTLPPRYRNENDETTSSKSIFTDDNDDGNFYKYDNEPDCVCTPKYLCNENNTIITDGAGIINERAYSICGKDKVCCRIPKASDNSHTTTKRTPTNTQKPVNPTTALTANHCVKQSRNSNYLIRAGEWDRSSTLEYAPHHDRVVSQIISHPQYYSGGLYNDIALLKWQNPLTNEVNVGSICLPEENENFEHGKYCTVTGWGKSSEDSVTTDKLKFVKVPIVKHTQCERIFQNNRLGRHFRLHDSFICAGGEEGLDSCTNDGGSPLICPRDDGSFVLAGLVSWGLDCGQKNIPGAYTNIEHLLKWIKSHEINV
ncbi:CLUMA_CG009911, isoform A [Clunio marinus]|uniref:CLUMA_CG009911, isoform A n=1 Tax=Clunio marinus TaxID=568069 RepID=A0A1J1I914_9DIPT|nr:CLUMA_CG009911, isoform A [Clunio marinus]